MANERDGATGQGVRRAALVSSGEYLLGDSAIDEVQPRHDQPVEENARRNRILARRRVHAPYFLDAFRLAESAIAHGFRRGDSAFGDHEKTCSLHGQDAIRAVAGHRGSASAAMERRAAANRIMTNANINNDAAKRQRAVESRHDGPTCACFESGRKDAGCLDSYGRGPMNARQRRQKGAKTAINCTFWLLNAGLSAKIWQ